MKKILSQSIILASLMISSSAFADFGPITIDSCDQSSAELSLSSGEVSSFDKREFPEVYVIFHSEDGVWYDSNSEDVKTGINDYEFQIDNYYGGNIDKFAVMLKDKNDGDHYVTIENCY